MIIGQSTLGEGSDGSYDISDDSLVVGNHLVVGHFGTGSFNHDSGSVAVTDTLSLAENGFASIGNYDLSIGAVLTTFDEVIGGRSDGLFTQTGGSHHVLNTLTLGDESVGTGSLTISGGSLALGQDGFGEFFHHYGNNLIDKDLILGKDSGSDGFYELTDGLIVTGTELSIGRDGIGRFVQNGGAVDVGSSLDLADDDPPPKVLTN